MASSAERSAEASGADPPRSEGDTSIRLGAPALLKLLQLTSPALPVGAFAFSQGLEAAVTLGFIDGEASALDWLNGTLHEGLARLDLPVLARLHAALAMGDEVALLRWSRYLLASREARERRLEDEQLGRALARLLADRNVYPPGVLGAGGESAPYATFFALASVRYGIPHEEALLGFAFSWAENQAGALSRLVPLGQLATQRVLGAMAEEIPDAVSTALALADGELGSCLPGLAMASALHETQYTRLFLS